MLKNKIVQFGKYIYYKIVRNEGSPESIAKGVALGLFIGFFIPMFFQIIIVLPIAILIRAAKVPAIVFTFVSNHFTILFLYPLQCYLGSILLLQPLSPHLLKAKIAVFTENPGWQAFRDLGGDIALYFFAGGLFLGIIFAVPGYFIALSMVRAYRLRKEKRRLAGQVR